MRRRLWFGLTFLTIVWLPAADWSGVIKMEERLIGNKAASTEQEELNVYRDQLVARLEHARAEERVQSPTVARQLRDDEAFFQAELERVLVATGGSLVVSSSEFRLAKNRAWMQTKTLLLVADRSTNQALAVAGGRRETTALAQLPPVRPWPKETASEAIMGLPVQRFAVTADGHDCQVWVTPNIPNAFATALTPASEADKGSMLYVLAEMPGMPLALEYGVGEVRDRWEVISIEPKALGDDAFVAP